MLDQIADGRTDLVFDFLSEGHPADSTDPQGVSLIKWCAYYGDVSAIRFLLAPLHAALCKPNRPAYDAVLRILLADGANPNATTKASAETGSFMRDCRTRAETPLHRAAAFGTEDVIQLLLDAGATIDARDMNGDSPLTWASWHHRPGSILQKLCFGDFRISPRAVARWTSDHGMGWGNGMEVNLLGEPHV